MIKANIEMWKNLLNKSGLKFKELYDIYEGIIFLHIWLMGPSKQTAVLYVDFKDQPPFEYLEALISLDKSQEKNNITKLIPAIEWIKVLKSSGMQPKLIKTKSKNGFIRFLYVDIVGSAGKKFAWFFAVDDFDMVYGTFFKTLKG